MKQVKSKVTGDIGELDFDSREGVFIVVCYDPYTKVSIKNHYKNLEDLCEDWEDYEEPKEYWYIDDAGVIQIDQVLSSEINMRKSIGNYFETREEAERTVEKLLAWKRLKDKGFRFDGWEDLQAKMGIDDLMLFNRNVIDTDNVIGFRMDDYHDCIKDLNICFGGEE